MPNVTKEIRLICADLDKNHNKFWTGKLYDDGSVETFWGRVGDPPAHKLFPGEGESGLDKRAKDKMKVRSGKPPYVELKTVEAGTSKTSVVSVDSSDLEALALKQIKMSRPELRSLIGRLVRSNIHKITSSTNISYNATTGLFQTELGIVTPAGITEARDLLAAIKTELDGRKGVSTVNVNKYLCIVPQNIGRTRITAASLFPDDTAIQKQSDILDSLESSYQAIQKPTTAPDAPKVAEEQVFSLDLDMLDKDNEFDRLNHWYESSKKSMHGYDNVKVANIYKVTLGNMQYEDNLAKVAQKEVFHGTSEANLLSILKSGFRVVPPATAHIAGALFGSGIYGAIHSTKSLGYSKGRWGGSTGAAAWLFVCDFAMGNIFETKTWGAKRPSGYDSIWAKSGGGLYHDELIVPRASQAKIKYLLECK